ncbi:MAG: DEAD/DEAH box helicase, partial [Specibacter sp.]
MQGTTPAAAMKQFAAPTREWFLGAFGSPTPAQSGAWEAIAGRAHSLVVAPTGSGKTLAAFLWALDGLITGTARPGTAASAAEPAAAEPAAAQRGTKIGTRVLYISPLKALG